VTDGALMAKHRIYTTSFASIYPLYVAKAEKKGRTKAEVDQITVQITVTVHLIRPEQGVRLFSALSP
jgi:hypothetical protein